MKLKILIVILLASVVAYAHVKPKAFFTPKENVEEYNTIEINIPLSAADIIVPFPKGTEPVLIKIGPGKWSITFGKMAGVKNE